MFVSLNRKIIYSILLLFLITSVIFVYTFYLIYGTKIQEEQLYNIQRNQQYIDLLYKNINTSKELRRIVTDNPHIKIDPAVRSSIFSSNNEQKQFDQLTAEQKQISETSESFDKRYNAIYESLKIFGISSVLLVLSIIMLGYLISWWILAPLNKISSVSAEVSKGNLNLRIEQKKNSLFVDELDYLINTFNQMLDALQNVISEVKDKEAFLQALIDSIPDGIRVIDKDYNIIIANKAYYRQAGTKAQNSLKCYEASQGTDKPCSPELFHCPVREIMHKRRGNVKVVQQFCGHPDRHLSINAAPLIYSGSRQYIVESIRDLSEDINFSHQQKLSSLGFLSTSIAHEMKNHLGALRIILERLIQKFYQDKPDDSDDKKMLTLIYSELINCIDVPERLLKLTRSSGEKYQEINCAESICDVINLVDFEAKSAGIGIDFRPERKDLFIKGNEADFKMVVINIILNALKATNNGGSITISLWQDKSRSIKVSFADTGVGIAPENLSRIFDPFFSNGQDGSKKGTGLGLSIAKSIVEKTGGHISVESTLGKGSCFTLSFPPIKKLAKK